MTERDGILIYTHRECENCHARTPHYIFYDVEKKYIIRELQCQKCGMKSEEMVRKEEVE